MHMSLPLTLLRNRLLDGILTVMSMSQRHLRPIVNLQGEMAHTLRFMPNVLGFLGGLDNPTPVKQSDINRILGTAEETEIKTEEIGVPYAVDEAVKVTDGPFSGFSGIIEEVNAEKHKLKVMVKIFGRKTPLELGYNQVEKE